MGYEKCDLFEKKKIKFWYEHHFMENKIGYAACRKNVVSFYVP